MTTLAEMGNDPLEACRLEGSVAATSSRLWLQRGARPAWGSARAGAETQGTLSISFRLLLPSSTSSALQQTEGLSSPSPPPSAPANARRSLRPSPVPVRTKSSAAPGRTGVGAADCGHQLCLRRMQFRTRDSTTDSRVTAGPRRRRRVCSDANGSATRARRHSPSRDGSQSGKGPARRTWKATHFVRQTALSGTVAGVIAKPCLRSSRRGHGRAVR